MLTYISYIVYKYSNIPSHNPIIYNELIHTKKDLNEKVKVEI